MEIEELALNNLILKRKARTARHTTLRRANTNKEPLQDIRH